MGDLNGRTRQISENLSDALLNTTMVKTYRMMQNINLTIVKGRTVPNKKQEKVYL